MKKKKVQDLCEGAMPKKAEPPQTEWNVDELLGPRPRGYYRRWKWYQEIARKEKEEEEKKENVK